MLFIVFSMHRFPKGLEDVSKYPNLIQELLQRGWKENDLANVLRRNFMRVFEEVERVSAVMTVFSFRIKLVVSKQGLGKLEGLVLGWCRFIRMCFILGVTLPSVWYHCSIKCRVL